MAKARMAEETKLATLDANMKALEIKALEEARLSEEVREMVEEKSRLLVEEKNRLEFNKARFSEEKVMTASVETTEMMK